MSTIDSFMARTSLSTRRYMSFGILTCFVVFWVVMIFLFDPREVIQTIGIENSYFIAFMLAMIGAFSSFTTVTIYPALVTLALGDLNFWMLGLLAGAGLAIGDLFFYYFGEKARSIVSTSLHQKLDKLLEWLEGKPEWAVQVTVYFYTAFTPFPNNLLTGSLALSGYPFRKIWIPVVLGDITFPLALILLAKEGIEFFV